MAQTVTRCQWQLLATGAVGWLRPSPREYIMYIVSFPFVSSALTTGNRVTFTVELVLLIVLKKNIRIYDVPASAGSSDCSRIPASAVQSKENFRLEGLPLKLKAQDNGRIFQPSHEHIQ